MPVSEKEYFEALRAADQRAVELLAKATADRINTRMVIGSILIALGSLATAVWAVFHSVLRGP